MRTKINFLPDPTLSFRSGKLIKAILRCSGPSKKRDPINRKLLHCLITAVSQVVDDPYHLLLFRALFALMYHACLRASEAVESNTAAHILRRKHVRIRQYNTDRKLVIKFLSFKHSDGHKPMIKIDNRQPAKYCPVHLYEQYHGIAPATRKYAFCDPSGAPITRRKLARVLGQCVSYLGLQGTYNTHSFRIGKATDMVAEGYTDEQIISSGRWRSNAFRAYIRPQCLSLP